MPTQNALGDTVAQTTKLVRVHLTALTLLEYTEVVEVPADITDDELDGLVQKRYDAVDGGLFVGDPHYWEKGRCFATDADASEISLVAEVRARRVDDGIELEQALPQEAEVAAG